MCRVMMPISVVCHESEEEGSPEELARGYVLTSNSTLPRFSKKKIVNGDQARYLTKDKFSKCTLVHELSLRYSQRLGCRD